MSFMGSASSIEKRAPSGMMMWLAPHAPGPWAYPSAIAWPSAASASRSRCGDRTQRRRGRGRGTVVDDAPREDAARVADGRRLLVVDDGRRVALGGLRRPPGLGPRRRRRGRRLRHRDRARRHGPARDVVRPVRGVLVLRVLVEGRARREEREHGVEVLATLLRRLRRGAEPGVLRHFPPLW